MIIQSQDHYVKNIINDYCVITKNYKSNDVLYYLDINTGNKIDPPKILFKCDLKMSELNLNED